MSVEADKTRSMRSGDNVTFGSLSVDDTTQENYCGTYSAKENGPTTYVMGDKAGDSFSWSAGGPFEGTLINPNGI